MGGYPTYPAQGIGTSDSGRATFWDLLDGDTIKEAGLNIRVEACEGVRELIATPSKSLGVKAVSITIVRVQVQ